MKTKPSHHFYAAIGIFLLTVSVSGFFSGGHVYVRDGAAMYLMSASILDHQWIDVDHRHPNTVGGQFGPDGKYYMPFGFLQPLLAVPFVALGRFLTGLTETQYLTFFSATVFNWLVTGCLAVAIFCGFLKMGVSATRSVFAALATIFTTPFWVYSQTFFSEPLTALLTVLAWLAMVHYRQSGSPRILFLSGCLAGLIPSVRPLGGVIIPPLFLYLLLVLNRRSKSRGNRRLMAHVLTFIVPVLTGIAVYLGYNYARFGDILETGYNRLPDGSLRSFTLSPIIGARVLLFSPGKSIFIFAPLLLLIPVAMPRLLREKTHRRDGIFFSVSGALYFIVLSAWARVEGGVSWGPRLFLPVVPLLFLSLSPVFQSKRSLWRLCVVVLAVAGLAVQLAGVSYNFSTYVYQHIDAYFSPVDGHYMQSFNPVPGHIHAILNEFQSGEFLKRRPPEQAAWNRRTDQVNPMDGLDFWWLHFRRDGVPSAFIVTSFLLLCLILMISILCLRKLPKSKV